MTDISAATWRTHIDGREVEIPATIEGIRAIVPEGDVEKYDAQVRHTPAQDLHKVLARWALPQEAADEDDAVVARLRSGDFSGCVPQDDEHRTTGVA